MKTFKQKVIVTVVTVGTVGTIGTVVKVVTVETVMAVNLLFYFFVICLLLFGNTLFQIIFFVKVALIYFSCFVLCL